MLSSLCEAKCAGPLNGQGHFFILIGSQLFHGIDLFVLCLSTLLFARVGIVNELIIETPRQYVGADRHWTNE